MPTLTEQATALIAYLDQNTPAQPAKTGKVTVADLLQQSRQAHLAYRGAMPRFVNGVRVEGDPAAATAALATAARLRAQAELADQTHIDPAWIDDAAWSFSHPALLLFYAVKVKALLPPTAVAPASVVTAEASPVSNG